ncbi:MAG: histidine kinase [Cyanobacteria bacterium SID2]|nr:histidine kinase [Cyanobacteria bacterium SID2]MBP0004142.1 histidine kinase [Cyanobacteria bacterium SBC]
MNTTFHILVEGNPAIMYASRNGAPDKVLPKLNRFLEKFWDERETAGEHRHTPECLLAQVLVRFGFEICEDDFSNLRVGLNYDRDVDYLYWISAERQVSVWIPEDGYRANPNLGLKECRKLEGSLYQIA